MEGLVQTSENSQLRNRKHLHVCAPAAMGRFRRPAAAMTICVLLLLLLRACEAAGTVPGDSPSSSAAAAKQEAAAHARKLLVGTVARGGAPAARAAEAVAADYDGGDGCSEAVVQVSQSSAGRLPSGIPCYGVTITNACLRCTVRDVHVACGAFASTELVDPRDFRRVAYGDCLVRDGGPLRPGEAVAFEYANSFTYTLDVASVSCADI